MDVAILIQSNTMVDGKFYRENDLFNPAEIFLCGAYCLIMYLVCSICSFAFSFYKWKNCSYNFLLFFDLGVDACGAFKVFDCCLFQLGVKYSSKQNRKQRTKRNKTTDVFFEIDVLVTTDVFMD